MSSSSSFLILCILSSLLLFIKPTSARNSIKPFHARALILPVTKDPSTRQYITTIFQRTPLRAVRVALDIGGKSLWVACDREEYNSSTFKSALCHSPLCGLAKSTTCGDCWDGLRPGCNDNTCNNVIYNTIFKSAQIDRRSGSSVHRRLEPRPVVMARNFPFSCGSMFLGENLAKGIVGFGACYNASGFHSMRVGPTVPAVEFVLGNNVSWTAGGADVMVYVGEVVCLGFVDGGKKAKIAIVIVRWI